MVLQSSSSLLNETCPRTKLTNTINDRVADTAIPQASDVNADG